MDRLSILTKYIRLALPEGVAKMMDEELANLRPRKERKDPISLDMANGSWVGVTDQDMARWSQMFPGVNVQAELKKAALWVLGHPERAKVRWTAFLMRWLTKAMVRLEPKRPVMNPWDGVGDELG